MNKEMLKFLVNESKTSKERESKLLGKEKSSIQVNNFLFFPTEDYLKMLKNIYNLKEENLKLLTKIADNSVKKMEQQIKELTLRIPISKDSDTDFDFIEIIKSFYTNKLLSDFLSALLKVKDKPDIWINDWIWDEFTMPFFLCGVLKSERKKATEYIVMLKQELDKLKKSSNEISPVSSMDAFLFTVTEAKKKAIKQNPGKKKLISATARELKIPRSTLVSRLKDNNIDFNKL